MGLVHRLAKNKSCAGCHLKHRMGASAAITKTLSRLWYGVKGCIINCQHIREVELGTRAVKHADICLNCNQVTLMQEDLQILVFVEDRKSSEIICKMVRQKLAKKVISI